MSSKTFEITGCLEDCPFCSESAFCNFYTDKSIWDFMGDKNKPTFCKVNRIIVEEDTMNIERDMFLREKLNTGLFIDFKTWSGFGLLWEWAIKQDWWEDFLASLNIIKEYEGHLVDMVAIYSPEQFADAVYTFLKEKP